MTLYFPQAEAELYEAANFYESRQTGLGADFLGAVEDAVAEIEEVPLRWPILKTPLRRRLLAKYPFSIIYLVHRGDLVIVAIAHLSRRPARWMERLEDLSEE